MRDNIKNTFKKAALRTTLLVALPFAGFGVMSNVQAEDSYSQFNQQKYDICTPSKINSNLTSNMAMEQQFMLDDAMSILQGSFLASSYLYKQDDNVCLSSYDIPITNNNKSKGNLIFLMADKLVDKNLTSRGYPDNGRKNIVEGEFRTAMRMALTAEILTELHRNGDSEGLKVAMTTKFKPIFKNFLRNDDNDIYSGKATVKAIKDYFKITHHHHKHKISPNGIKRLYNMGKKPDAPNVFEDIFSNKNNFNIRYFTGDIGHNNIYNRKHRY